MLGGHPRIDGLERVRVLNMLDVLIYRTSTGDGVADSYYAPYNTCSSFSIKALSRRH